MGSEEPGGQGHGRFTGRESKCPHWTFWAWGRAYRAARCIEGAEVTDRSRHALQTLQDARWLLEADVKRREARVAGALSENRRLRREIKETKRETARLLAGLEAA